MSPLLCDKKEKEMVREMDLRGNGEGKMKIGGRGVWMKVPVQCWKRRGKCYI
jgi:hypothetical protein